ncbi:MAG TPA: hypothetical protein VK718_07925 [Ferruginibacter sp.]|jgi:hypothetical protein|nr:hypothetical protein [Ferruginibacter sp.]
MKALSKSIMATTTLALISATAWAENIGDAQAAAFSDARAVGGVILLILLLILPTFKSSKDHAVKTTSKSYY